MSETRREMPPSNLTSISSHHSTGQCFWSSVKLWGPHRGDIFLTWRYSWRIFDTAGDPICKAASIYLNVKRLFSWSIFSTAAMFSSVTAVAGRPALSSCFIAVRPLLDSWNNQKTRQGARSPKTCCKRSRFWISLSHCKYHRESSLEKALFQPPFW